MTTTHQITAENHRTDAEVTEIRLLGFNRDGTQSWHIRHDDGCGGVVRAASRSDALAMEGHP